MQDSTTQTLQESVTEHVQKTVSELGMNNQQEKKYCHSPKTNDQPRALLESFTFKN